MKVITGKSNYCVQRLLNHAKIFLVGFPLAEMRDHLTVLDPIGILRQKTTSSVCTTGVPALGQAETCLGDQSRILQRELFLLKLWSCMCRRGGSGAGGAN